MVFIFFPLINVVISGDKKNIAISVIETIVPTNTESLKI